MRKLTTYAFLTLAALFSGATSAADDWKGELYGVMSKNDKVTTEFCKSHVPDTYTATKEMIHKDITASNGVKAKNLGATIKMVGGVYFKNGTASVSGTTDGKEWKEKVYYFGQMVDKDGMEQGVWYTKDCKGFFKVGPST